jgi:hypothetical protein
MPTYIIKGQVLPIRAVLSIGPWPLTTTTLAGTDTTEWHINIVLNEITIYCKSASVRDIYDLRNISLNVMNTMVSQVGYFFGLGYNVAINQILCEEIGCDVVFGIGIPALAERYDKEKIFEFLNRVSSIKGQESRFVHRCFVELQLAISHPIDTPFYCYRAIECLRHFCGLRYSLTEESAQWKKLVELTGKDRSHIADTKLFSNHARHGDHRDFTSDQRADFFKSTWNVVDAFMDSIAPCQQITKTQV